MPAWIRDAQYAPPPTFLRGQRRRLRWQAARRFCHEIASLAYAVLVVVFVALPLLVVAGIAGLALGAWWAARDLARALWRAR